MTYVHSFLGEPIDSYSKEELIDFLIAAYQEREQLDSELTEAKIERTRTLTEFARYRNRSFLAKLFS